VNTVSVVQSLSYTLSPPVPPLPLILTLPTPR
jgi:hypothetical protein